MLILTLCLVQAQTVLAFDWAGLWFSPDQQAQRLMDKGQYRLAAGKFSRPEHIGAALFMAGEFEDATAVLGRSSSPEAHYNRGNAHIMLGQYDAAIEAYQSALTQRPGWQEAQQNMQIAMARKQAMAPPGDDNGGTGGMLGADEIVFDEAGRNSNSSGEQVVDAVEQPLDEASMRAMWLRKVETRPQDFLAARFNYQLATREQAPPGNDTAGENE